MTLIKQPGFGYHLNALNAHGKPNELNKAFHAFTTVVPEMTIFRLLMDIVPQLDFFVCGHSRGLLLLNSHHVL